MSALREALRQSLDRPQVGPQRPIRCRIVGSALDDEAFVLPDEEREATLRRAAEWNSSQKPYDAFELWLVEAMAVEAVRVEHFRLQAAALRTREARRAALCWEEDNALKAEEIGAG